MARKQTTPFVSFDEQLILFRFFLRELKLDGLSDIAAKLNSVEYEGTNESGNTYFFEYIARICKLRGATISTDKLRLYDENICRHTRQIGDKRGGINWKYFQYISLLFTEMYLDRYFSDKEAFCAELNTFMSDIRNNSLGRIDFTPYTSDKMNKLAFMCATGSGKTLIMHVNILQFLQYFRRAQRVNGHLSINKVIVLAPNEGMSTQHLDELKLSSISASLFEKDRGMLTQKQDVIVIDMNKLKEEGKVKTVSVMEAFEAQVEYEDLVRLWQLTSPLRSIVPQVVASLLLRNFFDFFGELKKAAPLSRSAGPPFLFLYLFPGFSLKQDVILRS